jgi:hypothetical protein
MVCLVVRHLQRVRLLFSDANLAARAKGLECQLFQFIQVTQRIQMLAHLLADVALPAYANFKPPKIGMPDRDIRA